VTDNVRYTMAHDAEAIGQLRGSPVHEAESHQWPGWSLLWSRRRTILAGALVVGILAAVGTILRADRFTSTASFMVETKTPTSSLSGLASQFGLNVGGATTESADFYADLILSPAILQLVVDSTVALTPAGPRISIVDLFDVEGKTPAIRRDRGIKKLQEQITSLPSTKTGIVTVHVTSPSAFASQEIADRCLRLLNEFNLKRRQSHAATEREFAAHQLEVEQRELRNAEDELQAFLQENRVADSPRLRFERDRLERQVQSKQQIYNTLSEAFEQARLAEVRDVPLITRILNPTLPSRADSKGTLVFTFFGLTFGAFLTGFAIILAEQWRTFRATLPQ